MRSPLLLDGLAVQCAPTVPSELNPAKQLATELVGTLPMIWGSSDLAGIAAYRLLCQLAENAKYPSVNGVLPEALHNQVVTFSAPQILRVTHQVGSAARHRRAVAGDHRRR